MVVVIVNLVFMKQVPNANHVNTHVNIAKMPLHVLHALTSLEILQIIANVNPDFTKIVIFIVMHVHILAKLVLNLILALPVLIL